MRDGRVEMLRDGAPNFTLEGRSALGIFDAILDRPHARTAIAKTRLHLAKVRADDWLDLMEESFEIARVAVANSVRLAADLEALRWSLSRQPQGSVIAPVASSNPPLSFVDRLALLTDVAIVREAGVQVLVEVADLMEEMTFAAGQTLYERGRGGGHIFLVLGGKVIADRSDPNVSVAFGPGSLVCGMAAFGETASAWEARAVEPTRALALLVEDWFDLMEEHFDLVRSALRALALTSEALRDELASHAPTASTISAA
jgi:CRP-like cAMP-binding protein